ARRALRWRARRLRSEDGPVRAARVGPGDAEADRTAGPCARGRRLEAPRPPRPRPRSGSLPRLLGARNAARPLGWLRPLRAQLLLVSGSAPRPIRVPAARAGSVPRGQPSAVPRLLGDARLGAPTAFLPPLLREDGHHRGP